MALKRRCNAIVMSKSVYDLICWLDLHPHHETSWDELSLLATDVDLCWAVTTDPAWHETTRCHALFAATVVARSRLPLGWGLSNHEKVREHSEGRADEVAAAVNQCQETDDPLVKPSREAVRRWTLATESTIVVLSRELDDPSVDRTPKEQEALADGRYADALRLRCRRRVVSALGATYKRYSPEILASTLHEFGSADDRSNPEEVVLAREAQFEFADIYSGVIGMLSEHRFGEELAQRLIRWQTELFEHRDAQLRQHDDVPVVEDLSATDRKRLERVRKRCRAVYGERWKGVARFNWTD
jgi:hypothetical protein